MGKGIKRALLGPATGTIGRTNLKHADTYKMSKFPFETEASAVDFSLDRWSPVGDNDKEQVVSYNKKFSGWHQVGNSVWFGFEEEAFLTADHIDYYFNLVVIRPTKMNKQLPLELVSKAVS